MAAKSKLAPRNPLVAAGLFRKAGAHGKSNKAQRRKDRVETLKSVGDAGSGSGLYQSGYSLF